MKKILIIAVLFLPVFLQGQIIKVKETVSDSKFPEITWFTTGKIDTTGFKVFRASVKEKIFTGINTIHYVHPFENSDTVEFAVVDTTLVKKGIFLYYIEVSVNGKTVRSAVATGHNFGLLPRPGVTAFTATPLKDRKAVRLNWRLNYTQTVSSLELYRSNSFDTGYIKISDLPADTTGFTDVIPRANEPWFYYLVVNDFFGGKRPSTRIPAFATFAEKPFRPQNFNGKFSNDTATLTWKNTGKNIIGYRIYRSLEEGPFRQLNDMAQTLKENVKFTDVSPELKAAKKVSYYVRNVSDGFVESVSSDTLTFYIPEHEPVFPPETLDYVNGDDGNIKLLWMPPIKGTAYAYNIYLIDNNKDTLKLNNEKLGQNYYIDTILRLPGKYRYEVESIGFGNKTSDNRASITVYRYNPKVHIILNLKKKNNGIEISWKRSLNNHVVKLKLYKKQDTGKAVLKKSFDGNVDTVYLDTKVNKGDSYLYILMAELDNGNEVIANEGVEMIF